MLMSEDQCRLVFLFSSRITSERNRPPGCSKQPGYSATRRQESIVSVISAPSEWVEEISLLHLPATADERLCILMDRNTEGQLSTEERFELQALIDLSERLSLVRADALALLGRRPK
jgi:hypothetical protein